MKIKTRTSITISLKGSELTAIRKIVKEYSLSPNDKNEMDRPKTKKVAYDFVEACDNLLGV